jgi:acyl-CoA synthetase (NDP forming)
MTVTRDQLQRLLSPRRIAVLGARSDSKWLTMLMDNLEAYGFDGELELVHPRGGTAFNRPVAKSCAELEAPIDVAIITVRADRVADAMRDAKSAGAAGAVVLASGFGETGQTGTALEGEIAALSRALDLPFLGPNGLGFANLAKRTLGWLGPIPRPVIPGSIAVVSQSGNVAGTVGSLAARQGVGISHLVSTGNEAVIDVADVIDYFVYEDSVRVIAVFAESIAQPSKFLAAASRAADREKPIVMLKIGRSALAQRLAQTHTGALVGDDRIIDAAFRASGVIRVNSIEQMVATSGLLAHTGVLSPGGLGVVSTSGGTNDMIADLAEAHRVRLPELSTSTEARFAALDLAYAAYQNPFDVTGAGVRDEAVWANSISALLDDSDFALVAAAGFERLAHASDHSGLGVDVERLGWISEAVRQSRSRAVILLNTFQDVSAGQRASLIEMDAPHVLTGLDCGLAAIANSMSWSRWIHKKREQATTGHVEATGGRRLLAKGGDTWGEAKALELLARHNIPVVPSHAVSSAESAVEAARGIGYPVVVKVSAETLAHKSDVGGVLLSVADDAAVRYAYDQVTNAAREAGHQPDGVLIAPMRSDGTDLILGTVRDAQWGILLVVGMGGVDVEVLDDQSMRLLPIDHADAVEMLSELRGRGRLTTPRTGIPAGLDEIAYVVQAFADFAVGLGDSLASAEINPLRVAGPRIEALDALIEWAKEA